MTDRIALIAGVGGATGAALSRRFAQGGYRVAMIARNAERLAELETEIPRARGYPCDVAKLDRLGETVERVQTEHRSARLRRDRGLAQSLAKDLGPKRVHVGYITIDAAIDAPWRRDTSPLPDWQDKPGDYFAHPDAIADEVYHIAHQHPSTWSFDHVIRPFAENWTLN